MVTVKEILSLPALRKLTLIGGSKGLNNRVSYVTVMEVPDVLKWLKGNDFIITSLYAYKDDINQQLSLIDKLADSHCSCLAIKTGQYVKKLDKSIIERANERNLALVEIPNEVTYIEIIVNAMGKILENRDIDYMIEKYIKDILFNNEENELTFERGNLLGINLSGSSIFSVTLSFIKDATEEEILLLRNIAKKIAKESDNLLRFTYNPVITQKDKSSILFLSKDEETLKSNSKELIELIINHLFESKLENIHIGVGPIGLGLDGLKDSYFKSFDVLKVGSKIKSDESIFYYDQISIYITLEKYLKEHGDDVFQELSLENELIQTLDEFYKNNMDVNLTAEKLFLHKNTVRYRLKKIKDITGYDTWNFEHNFILYLFLVYIKLKSHS